VLQAASAGEWKAQPAAKGGKSDGSAGRNSGETAIEQGMVRLWMNLGNRNGLRPGDIVGAIAGETGIPGRAIGEINIQRNYTLLDVMEKHVQSVLQNSNHSYRIKGKPVQIRLADVVAG